MRYSNPMLAIEVLSDLQDRIHKTLKLKSNEKYNKKTKRNNKSKR